MCKVRESVFRNNLNSIQLAHLGGFLSFCANANEDCGPAKVLNENPLQSWWRRIWTGVIEPGGFCTSQLHLCKIFRQPIGASTASGQPIIEKIYCQPIRVEHLSTNQGRASLSQSDQSYCFQLIRANQSA